MKREKAGSKGRQRSTSTRETQRKADAGAAPSVNERVRAYDVRQDCLDGFARHRRNLEAIAAGYLPLTSRCEHCKKEPTLTDVTAVVPSAADVTRAIVALGRFGLGEKQAFSQDQVNEMFNRFLAAVEYEIGEGEQMARIFTQVERLIGEYGG